MSEPRVFRVGIVDAIDPGALDPHDSLDLGAWVAMAQVFEQAVNATPGEDGLRLEASLAHAPPWENTGEVGEKEARVRLRKSARFSDGTPCDAEAVVASWDRSPQLSRLGRWEVETPHQILVRPERTLAELQREMAKPWASVVGHRLDAQGRPLGTGPFAFAPADYTLDVPGTLALVRNPHWDGPATSVDAIEFVPYEDPEAMALALSRKKIHHTSALDLELVEGMRRVNTEIRAASSTALLWFNCQTLDLAARRCLRAAINPSELVRAAGEEEETTFLAHSVLPKALVEGAMGTSDSNVWAVPMLNLPSDPRAAYQGPRQLKLLVVWGRRAYLRDPLSSATAVREQLREVGVEVELVLSRDATHYQDHLKSGAYDLVLGGWHADSTDPFDFLDALFSGEHLLHPDSPRTVGCNFSRLADPKVDAALAQLRDDPLTLPNALAAIDAHCPVLPLSHGASVIATRREVQGFVSDPVGHPRFAAISFD